MPDENFTLWQSLNIGGLGSAFEPTLKTYFKTIASEIKDSDAIVLFGPAEIKDKFNKALNASYKDLSAKVKDVVTADSMTKRQVKAWVKAFYKKGRL